MVCIVEMFKVKLVMVYSWKCCDVWDDMMLDECVVLMIEECLMCLVMKE